MLVKHNTAPFAIFFKFRCSSWDGEYIKDDSLLEYLKQGESFEDCRYRIADKLVKISTESGYNVWIEDMHEITAPTDGAENDVTYCLS